MSKASKKSLKNNLIASVALASLALSASTADAAGRWPNWYVGLHGAMAFVSDDKLDSNPAINSFSHDAGAGYGASIGYRPAIDDPIFRNFRLEFEWMHTTSDIDKLKTATAGAADGVGNTRVNAAMGNIFYDYFLKDQQGQVLPFGPYAGVGLGMASVKLDGASTLLGNVSNKDNVFAWQFLTGLNYSPSFMPFTEWTVGYRYFNTQDPRFAYVGGGKFSADYSSHNLEAGVRFLF
jgi:opacity protein-like surface antigen